MLLKLGDIIQSLGGTLYGAPDIEIEGLNSLESATAAQISFLSHSKYQYQLPTSLAACVIVAPAFEDVARARGACIVTPDPYLYFARLTRLWKSYLTPAATAGVHSSAVVDPLAYIDPTAIIGPFCVVEKGARIGAHTHLKSRITIGEDCVVGDRCILHSGVVIGADGFGFAKHQGTWEKIEQLGAVRIGNDVEIGANTCIDRGALGATTVGRGSKIDNLVQIGHNNKIGRHVIICGQVGVSGSCQIEDYAILAGSAGIADHVTIGQGAVVMARAGVAANVAAGTHIFGSPAKEKRLAFKEQAALSKLPALLKKVKELEDKIQLIENK